MKAKGNILIVDDNADLLAGLKMFLTPYTAHLVTLKNPNLISEILRKELFDAVLLDMNFSAGLNTGNEGIYWMHRILEVQPFVSVVLITAFGNVELAVKAMKEGATDFIQKSWDEEKILSSVLSAVTISQSRREIQDLRQKQKHLSDGAAREYVFCEPVSSAMKKISSMVTKVAPTEANVLVLGENGTGKELVAREIHRQSDRSEDIFVSVNIGAIPDTLFESELFGHVKGAFTDAKEAKPGRIELAHKGTLFLDEIGNLPLSMQSKLLTVLQERRITRLGSSTAIPVDFRLVCATNMPLSQMVEEGSFRQDLLFRINTIVIEVPPLRERPEDIPVLVEYYLQHYACKYSKSIQGITRSALEKLKAHHWPGNIRELQHTIEKTIILCESDMLKAEDIIISGMNQGSIQAGLNLADNEKALIGKAMKKNRGNVSLTARDLGINRSTLYEKLKRYGFWPL
jgi:two-component system, NtrC family, response regulator HydG